MDSLRPCFRAAGVFFLLTILAGGFGEAYAPSRLIVRNDAAATAANLTTHETLFRIGFAAYLVEALCDVALAWLFFVLLRPVNKDLALLAAFFGLVSTATFATAQLIYFSSSLLLTDAAYLKTFTADQQQTLAYLAVKSAGVGGGLFMAFYGVASLLRGYLIYRSGYIPKLLGVLLGVAGAGFVIRNVLLVLAPRYATNLLLLPMFVAGVGLTGWFLAKGWKG